MSGLSNIKPKFIRNGSDAAIIINLTKGEYALKGWEFLATIEQNGWASGIIALHNDVKIELPDILGKHVIRIVFYNYFGKRLDSCYTAEISSSSKEAQFIQTAANQPQRKKTRRSKFALLFLLLTVAYFVYHYKDNNKNNKGYKEIAKRKGSENNRSYDTDVLNKPIFHVGDSYKYKFIVGEYNGTTRKEIKDVSDDHLRIEKIGIESQKIQTIINDSSLGLKIDSKGNTFEPAYQYFKFPGKVGDSWTSVSIEKWPAKDGKSKIDLHNLSGLIVCRERITVRAGIFNTWKIVLKDQIVYYNGTIEYLTDTSWYSPEVKNSVKSEIEKKNESGEIFNRRTVELVDYSLK